MTTYQIAEVAERSGFSPATLRYYEDIGLMTPVGRTDAGYRLYDDASVERLGFISRAKQLGCSLEEIAELAVAWEGGECGPLQDRLRSTVDGKLADVGRRIEDLAEFRAELRRAAAALGRHRPDGPCDADCGCTTGSDPQVGNETGGGEVPLGIPIACSLQPGEIPDRIGAWAALLEENRAEVARIRLEDGIRIELGPDTDVAEIARLAAAEQGCCRFFSFALTIDHRGIGLEVHAPPEAAEAVAALFGPT